jgi:hypothetical protein
MARKKSNKRNAERGTPATPRNLLNVKLPKAAYDKPATPEQAAEIVREFFLEPLARFGGIEIYSPWFRPDQQALVVPRPRDSVFDDAVRRLSGTKWIASVVKERRDDLLAMSNITDASRVLAEESKTACAKPLTPRYIEKLLRPYNVWPKARRNSAQRPK